MDHKQPRPSLHPAVVEALDHRSPVAVAAEEYRCILRLEHHQSWEGGPAGITRRGPGEAALILQGDALQLAPQPLQARRSVVAQIKPLQICRDRLLGGRLVGLHHLKDRFAQRTRLGELGKAPAGGTPVRCLQDQQRLAALDLLVELALPLGARRNAAVLIEIEEGGGKSLPIQPGLQLSRSNVVAAGVGEEDAGHWSGGNEAEVGHTSNYRRRLS